MIWLYFLIPVFIICALAVYFEKKSGMSLPDGSLQEKKLHEVSKQNGINTNGTGSN
ncbi:hypothetical protein M4D55_03900 [Metabacillus idriensis]|uniref:Uncharacterized protein n=1 Tax=Metabacillus idriensis TaxID=324768 RepID=A0A6I2M840_9BACI|nr:hypothetical protein [Metabacillus idriensis]MCM3594931.1 hypothetical protein [Metabacillus idriensis]MRX53046.1 hypothetical protein [Metabacillus idriensis]